MPQMTDPIRIWLEEAEFVHPDHVVSVHDYPDLNVPEGMHGYYAYLWNDSAHTSQSTTQIVHRTPFPGELPWVLS